MRTHHQSCGTFLTRSPQLAALVVLSFLCLAGCAVGTVVGGDRDTDAHNDADEPRPPDGDADIDGDSDSDIDADGDGDSDTDTDADGDIEPDGDVEPDGDTPGDADVVRECTLDEECLDDIDCTFEECVEGVCAYDAAHELCPDGELCHIVDGCVPATGWLCAPCPGGAAECTTESDRCGVVSGDPVCLLPCEPDGWCPAEFSCGEVVDRDGAPLGLGCTPTSGVCCLDIDGDGAGTGAHCALADCDETSTEVYEGAPETCNDRDDDCNGAVDDGLTRGCSITNVHGECHGTESCTTGSWGGCTAVFPTAESCDNSDNDCDGAIDEELSRACSNSNAYGTCRGTESCSAGDWGACSAAMPSAEICDGVDNDCDGAIDEDSSGSGTIYRDADGDGYGDPSVSRIACDSAPGWVENDDDCDDDDIAVNPDAADAPDDSFEDRNCDGLDGDRARLIFASTTGNDRNPGTPELPVRTIGRALTLADSGGRDVAVASGTYAEAVTLHNGVSIHGGYAADWSRSASRGATFRASSRTVTGSGISSATVIEWVTIVSTAAGAGVSSYAVFLTSSSGVVLRHCDIQAGRGGDGSNGSTPAGTGAAGRVGGAGGAGCEESSGFCSGCSRPRNGAAGTSSCGRTGGIGGTPGHGGSSGSAGGTGTGGTAGGSGTPAERGDWNTPSGYWGRDGADGRTGGSGIAGSPSYGSGGYAPSNGRGGSPGDHGNGGGGGGGGGGGTTYCDSYGGGGGGGGGGGCRGNGGGAGTSAGGSFGVYLWSSSVTIEDCHIQTAGGGRGGAGANGQRGGSGGEGGHGTRPGTGNPYGGSGEQDDGSNGGRGGWGGDGGPGGPGGGGAGGPSVAVLQGGGSSPTIRRTTYDLGASGAGGSSSGNPGPRGTQSNTYTP